MKQPLMDAKEAAAFLHVHPETLRKWTREGRVPFLRIGDKIRVDQAEIEEFLGRGKAKILIDSPALSPIGLDAYDKLYLRRQKKAVNKESRRCWNYAIGRVFLVRAKKGDRWCIDFKTSEGQRRREVVKAAQNRGEALIALQERVRQVFDGKFKPRRIAEHTKFSQLADLYLEHAKTMKKSWKTDEFRLVSVRRYFDDADLDKITTARILEYRQARLKSGISELTTNRERALLSAMFNFGIEEGLMKVNPVKKVRAFSEHDTARTRILSAAEEKRLFEELAQHIRPVVLMALHTGMRRSEILNLRWADVNLESKIIKVEKTKSGKVRFMPINSILLAELVKLRAERNGQLVFPFRNVRTAFQNACRRAGLADFTFHDLRRSFGTRLLEHGFDIVTIQKLYGHSSVLVTAGYLHPNNVLAVEAVESLAEIWQGKNERAVPVPANQLVSVH